jgi:uncharacterized protein (DUF849 family)
VLIKAAINGTRTPTEHPAVPVTPEQQAREACAAVAAGAGAIHVHVRSANGRESLNHGDVASALEAIRGSCPGVPVGVSTGAWMVPNGSQRLSIIRAWDVLPDFASVNAHEEGATQIISLLLDKGVGVEAGVWNSRSAEALLRSGLADECLRILIEPAEETGDARANWKGSSWPSVGSVVRVCCTVLGHRLGNLLSWRQCVAMTHALVLRTR